MIFYAAMIYVVSLRRFQEMYENCRLSRVDKNFTDKQKQEMLLFKDKINYKGAKGNGFQPHLDAPAYDHIGKIEHVTANFAIDAATRENGCLEVVPGSHRMTDIELVDGGRISDAWTASQSWVEVPLAPGDVLIFGSHLAHKSAANKTNKPRASLYATFHGRSDGEDLRQKYYAHRRVAFPPDHGKFTILRPRFAGLRYWFEVQASMFPFAMRFGKLPHSGLFALRIGRGRDRISRHHDDWEVAERQDPPLEKAFADNGTEREEGQSYEAGWKTYGFAAPFSRQGIAAGSAALPKETRVA